MNITKDQAQMLTALACDSRPIGARQWKPDDVMAEIAKLLDRNLGAVVCAVTRAAMDRGAERPSVISSAGSHWSDTMVPQAFVPSVLAADQRCSICSLPEHACQMKWAHDHTFESAAAAASRVAGDVAERAAAIRATLEPTAGPTARRTLEDLAEANPKLHANLERVRQMIPDPPLREPDLTTEPATPEEAS